MMILPVAPLFILILLTDEAGVNSFTGLVMATTWLTTSLSAIYLGRLGDQIGHRRIIIFCCLTTALFYLPQAMVFEGWQLLLFQALSGLAAGGILPSISALLADYTPRGHEGAVYGLDNSISAAARALAPLVGVSVAIWINLRASFIATALVFFSAGILAILRLPKGQN
jgi:DHA1 family multidrug resistance protein-like MFS transporter